MTYMIHRVHDLSQGVVIKALRYKKYRTFLQSLLDDHNGILFKDEMCFKHT